MTVGQLARQQKIDVQYLINKLELAAAEPGFTPRVRIRVPRYTVRKQL
ncbi:MAG: hypothetical protein M1609_16955 [Firmicutes bacterium]|nr:hypothetical protein [Bacillota bacterium]